jgi:C-terminal processing protease CtpA/Prc
MKAICRLIALVVTGVLTACSGGGDDGGLVAPPPPVAEACSATRQKQFVLDQMQLWYLWNDLLPATVDLDAYATAEDLLDFLTTFSPADAAGDPVDRFSFLTTATSDQQFFGEGKFEGFGFSSRFVEDNDWRLTRVFADSPANRGGLARGQRIVALNGLSVEELEAGDGVFAFLDANATVDFTLRPVGGALDGSNDFLTTISKDIVTIDPLPQARVIDGSGGRKIGYIEFATFISTASPAFESLFADFNSQGVTELVIDMRYNGGGLVSTAELLGDYLGGRIASNQVFSRTEYNADRNAEFNPEDLIARFARLGNSMDLTDLVIVATENTASASELVINGLDPHTRVTIVGDDTFGKPVGQVGLELVGCDVLLRPTSFKTVNSLDEGDFFAGLPVDCVAADDLNIPVGADNDPNLVTALTFLETGSCPVTSVPGEVSKGSSERAAPGVPAMESRRKPAGPPWREFADAY